MSNENLKYSIVIPVYNSGQWLDELIQRIADVMENEAPGLFELILVDDCSPDLSTWPTIKRNAEKYSWIVGFRLLYNIGQFKATMCGMSHAKGKFVLNMDDDLQHLPEEIPKLIRRINKDGDVLCVMGKYETKRHSLLRNAGRRLYQQIINRIYQIPSNIETTSFRIMKKELADAVLSYRSAKPEISALIVSLTKKIKNVQVKHAPRKQGKSGYRPVELIGTTIDNIIYASTAPLRFFSTIGFLFSGASILIGTFFFLRWLGGGIGVPGFTSQILLIIFFGGMTLAGIGILGEYISRIITEVTGPKKHVIKERIDKK